MQFVYWKMSPRYFFLKYYYWWIKGDGNLRSDKIVVNSVELLRIFPQSKWNFWHFNYFFKKFIICVSNFFFCLLGHQWALNSDRFYVRCQLNKTGDSNSEGCYQMIENALELIVRTSRDFFEKKNADITISPRKYQECFYKALLGTAWTFNFMTDACGFFSWL